MDILIYVVVDARLMDIIIYVAILMPTVLWASNLYIWHVDDDKLMPVNVLLS
jgi:hypothetical protein